jgi:hypothetical protein
MLVWSSMFYDHFLAKKKLQYSNENLSYCYLRIWAKTLPF